MAHLQPAVAARNVRERTEEEMEPATFKLATGPATGQEELAPVQMVRIRSTHSVHEAIIEFVNESGRPVRAIWLDFAGNEVAYTVIEPSTKRRYRTYVSHPWIIRDVSSGSRMMLGTSMVIVASSAEHKVVISSPPPLAWTLDTHKFYPEDFKAGVRGLLLAHQRVRNGTACSHPQAPTPFSLAASTAAPFSAAPHACPSVCGSVYCDRSSSAGLLAGSNSSSSLDQMMMEVDAPPMAAPLPASMLMDCPAAVSSCADALYSTTPSTLAPSNTTPASLISSMSSSLADMLDVDMSDAAPSLNPTPLSSVAPSTRASYQHLLPPRYPQAPAAAALALQSAPLYGQQHLQQQQLCSRSSSGDCSAFCTGHAAPLSPRTFQKAARMFGWVVEKVVHAVKSPIRAAPPRALPKPQPPMTRCTEQPCSTRADGPLLELMEQLPTHLVLHIVALMAPRDVMQCITRGPAEAHPDVSPALLQSDPATWPAVTAPQELLPQQPMQQ